MIELPGPSSQAVSYLEDIRFPSAFSFHSQVNLILQTFFFPPTSKFGWTEQPGSKRGYIHGPQAWPNCLQQAAQPIQAPRCGGGLVVPPRPLSWSRESCFKLAGLQSSCRSFWVGLKSKLVFPSVLAPFTSKEPCSWCHLMAVLGGLCRPVHPHSVPSVEEGGGEGMGREHGAVGELWPRLQGEGWENWWQGRELVPRKMGICLVRMSQIGGFSLGILELFSPSPEGGTDTLSWREEWKSG